MAQADRFEFSLSKKNNIVVASLSGSINLQTIFQFEKCAREILAEAEARFIAIDLSALENVTLDAVPALVRLQKIIRDRQQPFRLCGLEGDLKSKLHKLGVIRFPELSATLKDSLVYAVQLPALPPQPRPSSEDSKKAG